MTLWIRRWAESFSEWPFRTFFSRNWNELSRAGCYCRLICQAWRYDGLAERLFGWRCSCARRLVARPAWWPALLPWRPPAPPCDRRSGSLPRSCAPNFVEPSAVPYWLRSGARSLGWLFGRTWYWPSISHSRLAPQADRPPKRLGFTRSCDGGRNRRQGWGL